MIKFFINPGAEKFRPEITYILKLWSKNQGQPIEFTAEHHHAISIGTTHDNTLQIAPDFHNQERSSNHRTPFIYFESSKVDSLASAFTLINSMQEFQATDPDELNRFRFRNSYQFKLNNAKENLVQQCFNEISHAVGLKAPHEKTRFLLSHDIDIVYGAILEDGFNVLKKGRIDLFLKMLFNLAMGKPEWLNMDKIMDLESVYDCKSVFFWIVNKGKINERERNADYSFRSRKIQQQYNEVLRRHFDNGIHKSISSETFAQEFAKYGSKPHWNRYHYLKFTLPQAYHDIDTSGLKLDTSLGFAEEIGFRNSYGLPFNPFNFKTRKPYSFVEAPLHVMDRTFFQYKKSSPELAEKDIIDFFERNSTNCILSVLWHNNFFTDYKFKGYMNLYKKILSFIKDNDLRTISPAEIVDKYSIA